MAVKEFENKKNSDTMGCDKGTKIDRLSRLPSYVLDTILVKLPLRDAIRTSILSKEWRYKWGSLSQFAFDSDEASWGDIRKIVYQYLLHHHDTIDRFNLSAHCKDDYCDLYQWIYFLSKKGVKEFVLEQYDRWLPLELPSSMFAFQQLRHLQLKNCMIKVPCAFIGFSSLASLCLRKVYIGDDMLENLIFSCPVLERLTLIKITGLGHLKIHGPNLNYLELNSKFNNISFENTPILASIHMNLIIRDFDDMENTEQERACNLLTALNSLPGLERLSLVTHLLKFLDINDANERLRNAFNNLIAVDLRDMDCNNAHAFRISLSILKMFSHLLELNLMVNSSNYIESSAKCLDGQEQLDFFFHNLKAVRLGYNDRMGAAIEFLKLILGHSPMLEIVTITKHGKITLPEKKIRKTLQWLKQASPQVKIIYQATRSSISYLF